MPLPVVARGTGADQAVEHPRPHLEAATLRDGAVALFELGTQLAGALARPAALDQQRVARRLHRRQRRGRLAQLLEPLPEVLPVLHDRLHLAVQDAQHLGILGAERPATRRARSLGPELLDLVPLLLHLVVLLEQIGAARGRVFLLPHPRGPLLFGGPLGDLEPLAQRRPARASACWARARAASASAAARRACSSRAPAAARSRSSAACSGSPASRPCSSAARAFFCSRIRSCARLSCSYRSTRDRNAARSGRLSCAITARSFCPVKYVLKNSSCVIPSPRSSFAVTSVSEFATSRPSWYSSALCSPRTTLYSCAPTPNSISTRTLERALARRLRIDSLSPRAATLP